MSGSSMIQIVLSFAIALVCVILPWGIPFLIKDVGTVFLPLSALISGGVFLFLLGRAVRNGDWHSAIGTLLVPFAFWLTFAIVWKWPGEKALAECHQGATEVRMAQNQYPRHIILENFYDYDADYKGVAAAEALAILKNAAVLWSVEGSRSKLWVGGVAAKEIALCRLTREEQEKGEYANESLRNDVYFDQRRRKIDRCLVSWQGEPRELEKADAVIFRRISLGGGCMVVDITERNSTGAEQALGTVKYNLQKKELYPELRKQGENSEGFPLSFIARAVFGDKVSVSALRQHIVD